MDASGGSKVDKQSDNEPLTKAELRCRFYRREFPAVDEVVMTKVHLSLPPYHTLFQSLFGLFGGFHAFVCVFCAVHPSHAFTDPQRNGFGCNVLFIRVQ